MPRAYRKLPKLYIVYVMRCRATGSRYVGCTSSPLISRLNHHEYNSRTGRGQGKLHNEIRIYGLDSFDSEIIFQSSDKDEAFLKEAKIVAYLKPELNITKGGLGSRGLKHTEATKRRLSSMRVGVPLSDQTKSRMKRASRPAKLEEEKLKHRMRNSTPEAKAVFSAYSRGEEPTEEMLLSAGFSPSARKARKRKWL